MSAAESLPRLRAGLLASFIFLTAISGAYFMGKLVSGDAAATAQSIGNLTSNFNS